tara:strand:- start:107 stop:958 length:852 start_codon:yes stop_codon:yes gene_type:complete
MYKLAWNISFHWQLDQLKFHLDNILNFDCVKDSEFVFTSAHEQNMIAIHTWLEEKYPDTKANYIFLEEDKGNHIGCIQNVTEGIKYIKENLTYDYLINVEADNMFWSEEKLMQLLMDLHKNVKSMLLVDHDSIYGPGLIKKHDQAPCKYYHTTTLNIYSKRFIDDFFPVEYEEEFMNYGWCGAPGTPYESYLALSMAKKNDLYEEEKMVDFFIEHALKLDYDQKRKEFDHLYVPDDLTPDRFMKYGILNCPNARDSKGASQPDIWLIAKEFIEKHEPLMYDYE